MAMPAPRLPKTVRFRLPKGVIEHFKRAKISDARDRSAEGLTISWLSRTFESLSVSGALVMLIACGCLVTVFVLEFTIWR